jgi:dihydroorotase
LKRSHANRADSILIIGGSVADGTGNQAELRDILVAGGIIKAIEAPGKIPRTDHCVIDAKGLTVAPGFIDLHVHLREPGQAHKETIATGTGAAAAGGFTTICPMPNTAPVNDNVEITRWMQSPERRAMVKVRPIAAATLGSNGQSLTNFKALVDAGAVGVSDDGRPILGDSIMRDALKTAKALGIPVIQHAEDTRMSQGCVMHAGPTSFRLGLRGVTSEAEASIVARDIQLAADTGAHVHVAHLSTRATLEAVREAKGRGIHVTCEVTPHHLLLSDEEVGDYDTNCKMNPPLRNEEDREAMWDGLHDGTIDCIATDHAPHAAHEKEQEFDRAPFGITGLETALPIALMVAGGDVPLAVRWLTSNPAQVMAWKQLGTLTAGAPADITIFAADDEWMFTAENSKSKSKNSPFIGKRLRGRVRHTIVNGRMVYSI